MLPDPDILYRAWKCACPRCGTGSLYAPGFQFDFQPACPQCGLDFSKSDNADGPAVFLIFILGFSVVPLALVCAALVSWPLWLHALVWGTLTLALTLGSLRPLKAYIVALQFKHRPGDWE